MEVKTDRDQMIPNDDKYGNCTFWTTFKNITVETTMFLEEYDLVH